MISLRGKGPRDCTRRNVSLLWWEKRLEIKITRLLFLEENPDIIPFLQAQKIEQLSTEQPELAKNLRQRLLKRARWQISFARSRLARTCQELIGFPDEVIATLVTEAFPYLNTDTLRMVEKATPTNSSTSLQQLLHFFQLDNYLIKGQQ